jgi:hypothetical protein
MRVVIEARLTRIVGDANDASTPATIERIERRGKWLRIDLDDSRCARRAVA